MELDEFRPENTNPKKHKQQHLLQAVREDEMNLETLGNECEGFCYLQARQVL
jgi:hypothetical protein